MDDHRGEFKSRFASTLLGLRADSEYTSQVALAADLNKRTPVSEATYRRWESVTEPHLPDAYEIVVLAELLGCDPMDLVIPKEMSSREREMARRIARGKQRGQDQAGGGA